MKWTPIAICSIAALLPASALLANATDPSPDVGLDETIRANNAFALDLYARLKGCRKDLCFSPCSVFEALGMAQAGARGATAIQITRAMHADAIPAEVHSGLALAVDGLLADSRVQGYELSVTNAVWHQQGHNLRRPLLTALRTHYQAKVRKADFQLDPEAARSDIEQAVGKLIGGSVEGLLGGGLVNESTHLVLVNTIRMKVPAAAPAAGAPAADAQSQPQAEEKAPAAPRDEPLSLVLFLTITGPDGRAEPVALTDPAAGGPRAQNLRALLEEMKMTDAFTEAADFSGISGLAGTHISGIVHGAWVREMADGVEAVAATVMVFSLPQGGPLFLTALPLTE